MTTTELRVLIVDDEASIRQLVESRLARKGFAVRSADSGEAALKALQEFDAHVIVSDLRMPGMGGFELLKQVKLPTILITGHGDKESAIQAVEAGAFAFFEKPFDLDALEVMVRRGAERRIWEIEREALLKRLDRLCKLQGRELENFDRAHSASFLGQSPRIAEIKALLARLAQKPNASLLILGETGTGKEVVAQELHKLTHTKVSDGGRTPFLALNCSAIPADLLESELFGHEKGAFSGAQNARIGLAEAVREGTLFLDEVGELDPRHQAKILRLLQERKFRRVGANTEMTFNGRIVAATHRTLPSLAKEGKFREDLYYRLAVITVELPPLRERREDLPLLLEGLCKKHGLSGVERATLNHVLNYDWPGNIRELNNWLERAAILGLHNDEGFVTEPVQGLGAAAMPARTSVNPAASLQLVTAPAPAATNSAADDALSNLPATGDLKTLRARLLDEYDRLWIERALDQHAGNVTAAARTLGIDRKNLTRRMKELEIKRAA